MEFIIPSDYCVALYDPNGYTSFVHEEWDLYNRLRNHLLTQMNHGTICLWGTNAPGNWRINFTPSEPATTIYREFTSNISIQGSKLYLSGYDELTMAAQYEDVKLTEELEKDRFISLAPGRYVVRVMQMFDPADAESESVFEQETPHYTVTITAVENEKVNSFKSIPWFVEIP